MSGKYTLADYVKNRIPEESLNKICEEADKLQQKNLGKVELSEEDKAIADKAAKLIARDYGEVLKRLEDE